MPVSFPQCQVTDISQTCLISSVRKLGSYWCARLANQPSTKELPKHTAACFAVILSTSVCVCARVCNGYVCMFSARSSIIQLTCALPKSHQWRKCLNRSCDCVCVCLCFPRKKITSCPTTSSPAAALNERKARTRYRSDAAEFLNRSKPYDVQLEFRRKPV